MNSGTLAPVVIVPVPADSPAPSMRDVSFGKPTESWPYRGAGGELLGHVAKYYRPGAEPVFIPWVWSHNGWIERMWPDPRPLYGLDRLAAAPRRPVLICDGEEAATVAQMFCDRKYVCVTWPGGILAAHAADWRPLAGRTVVLWPNAGVEGLQTMFDLATIVEPICHSLKIIDPDGNSDGWNATHAGFDWDAFSSWSRPRMRPVSKPKPEPPAAAGFAAWDALQLSLNGNGAPHDNLDNAIRTIEKDPELARHVWFDEFLDAVQTDWQGSQREWSDVDSIKLQLYLQRHIGLTKISLKTCDNAAQMAAHHDIRNECRAWLESIEWDGVDRLQDLFPVGFGSKRDAFTEAMGRCWLVSMVARVFEPGAKVDTVPVLEGEQGKLKSTALGIIGGKWYVECHESVLHKDFYSIMTGHMLVEIAEMHSFSRAEVERIKGVISCRVDRYRKPYDRHAADHPRRTVLAGTTNRDDWQKDDTGARRFWPVICLATDLDWIREHRDILFAEAVARYKRHEAWWDVPADLQAAETDARRETDAWEPIISGFLASTTRDRILLHEVLEEALKIEPGRQDQLVQKRAGRILRLLKWKNKPLRNSAGILQKTWVRPDVLPEIQVTGEPSGNSYDIEF
jgi:predicted P-loop ATPase